MSGSVVDDWQLSDFKVLPLSEYVIGCFWKDSLFLAATSALLRALNSASFCSICVELLSHAAMKECVATCARQFARFFWEVPKRLFEWNPVFPNAEILSKLCYGNNWIDCHRKYENIFFNKSVSLQFVYLPVQLGVRNDVDCVVNRQPHHPPDKPN